MDNLLSQLEKDNIKWIRFESCSCIGVSIGKLVPIAAAKSIIQNGMGFVECGWLCTTNDNTNIDDWLQTGYRNVHCKVYLDTYIKIPWSENKIASIMIYPTLNNEPLQIDPRTIALNQLNKLKDKYGIDLLSSFENEFFLFDAKTKLPLTQDAMSSFDISRLMQSEDFFASLYKSFDVMGIEIEAIHSEWGKGLYEIVTAPQWNILSADHTYRIKMGIREIAYKHKLGATFVSMPYIYTNNDELDMCIAGSHFNLSLWGNNKQNNLLFDSDNKSMDGLSDIARYWIGGILHHISGISIFSMPTSNCYERAKIEVNSHGTWARYNRRWSIRVKTNGKKTYLEYRIPSSLSNPYLVIASIIIAGIDGIDNKIEPPIEMNSKLWDGYDNQYKDNHFNKLPTNLKDALDELQTDELVCDQIGNTFIQHFIAMKKEEIKDNVELTRAKKHPVLFSKL